MAKALAEYKNQFSLDGRLRKQGGVTVETVREAKKLWDEARSSFAAEGKLRELFTSSDIGFSLAHLININTIPQLDKDAEEVLTGLAGERVVKDFNPVVLQSLLGSSGLEGAGIDESGAAAIVPEGTPYPIVTVKSDEESFFSKLAKRGFRFDFTFESAINDVLGFLDTIPGEMLEITKDTILAELFEALNSATQSLQGGTMLDGTTTIAPNAALSPMAVLQATTELEARTINGRKIGRVASVNVVAAPGTERKFEYDMSQIGRVIQVLDGSKVLSPDSDLLRGMPQINFIENDRMAAGTWSLYPKPGTTKRPVLERLKLRGYENPEIRVRNDQGYTPGGGKIGVFNGGFDADDMSFRYRHITGAVLWDDNWVVKSDGTGQ